MVYLLKSTGKNFGMKTNDFYIVKKKPPREGAFIYLTN